MPTRRLSGPWLRPRILLHLLTSAVGAKQRRIHARVCQESVKADMHCCATKPPAGLPTSANMRMLQRHDSWSLGRRLLGSCTFTRWRSRGPQLQSTRLCMCGAAPLAKEGTRMPAARFVETINHDPDACRGGFQTRPLAQSVQWDGGRVTIPPLGSGRIAVAAYDPNETRLPQNRCCARLPLNRFRRA
jgi:hypothetical protein